jgi:hypothetical protein
VLAPVTKAVRYWEESAPELMRVRPP